MGLTLTFSKLACLLLFFYSAIINAGGIYKHDSFHKRNLVPGQGPVITTGPLVNTEENGFREFGSHGDLAAPAAVASDGLDVAHFMSECAAPRCMKIESSSRKYLSGNIIASQSIDHLNLHAKRARPTGWVVLGCYTDSVATRTLPSRQFPAGDMTVELCIAACSSTSFVYAGVEYGGECYCGNSLLNGGGPAPDGDVGCNMPCNGNIEELCGGPNRLNLYRFGNGSTTTPTPVQSTPTPTPLNASIPTGWSYKGCWIDGAFGRAMGNQQPDSQTNTVESCINNCLNLGYPVAGMEYGTQCFCDASLHNAAALAPESDCFMHCAGNFAEKCGAGNRLSVYSNDTLQILPVPSIQKTNLPADWKYSGCLNDDFPDHVLFYQSILKHNNTANNCISQCSKFGYNAGGLEYGEECYCGDVSDTIVAGAQLVDESNCQMPCSGNSTSICGGSRKMSFYTWTGPDLHSWTYASGDAAGEYRFLIGGVVVPLITHPARNGKITFLEKWGTAIPPNTTGAYELDVSVIDNFTAAWRPMHVKTDIFCSASLTLPDKVGRQINIGGWANDATYGVRLYWPDGSPGVWGQNDWQEDLGEVSLQAGRWYPTAMILANGSILVVGGEEGSNGAPVPSLELLPKVGPTVFCDWLLRTDPDNLYPYLAVLPSGGVFVAYYNEARILDEHTFETQRVLPNMPGAVNNFLGGRTYSMEGSMVLLPQYAPYTEPLEVLVCGGSIPLQGYALDNCVSIAPEIPGANWTIERMPSQRVLSCMTALPDGTYLILNGAKQGWAGFGLATQPNHNAVLYDPRKPLHHRFTIMANTTIDRLYHSESVLMDDGRVLVSGSDPQDVRFVEEYRVEVFIPPYLMGDPVRPNISISENQKDWNYGGSYTFITTQAISKVSLLGSHSSTHGNTMGQRTLFPSFACSNSVCTVTAPPNSHVCPPGWFQMFALNKASVPSVAEWVRIGGDPAGLGNWPVGPSFNVPGV